MATSFFSSATGIVDQYFDLTYTQINAGTTQASAVLLATLSKAYRICYLFNSLDQDLSLWLVNPAVATVSSTPGSTNLPDPSQLANTANRILWMQLPKAFNLNFDDRAIPVYLDPNTRIYVSLAPNGQTIGGIPQGSTTAATTGKLRIVLGA